VPQLDDVLKRIDDDTTALATTVKDLRDRLSTSMSQADVDAAKGTLSAIADRLEATAKSPDNPVPPGPAPVMAKKRP
jgi:hypothetical protein